MTVTKRRWVRITGVVVLTVAGVVSLAGCGADKGGVVPGGDRVDIDLKSPKFEMDARSSHPEWSPSIVNDTGTKLTDVELTFTIADPGGDRPPLEFDNLSAQPSEEGCMDEEGEIDADCVKHDKRLKRQACDVPEPRDEEERFGRTLTCVGDIPTGDSRILLYPTMIGLDLDNAGDFADYPDLKLSAKLTAAGQTITSASGEVAITGKEKYQRISFDGVPEEIPSDRTAPDGFDWSVTVTNDTDADLEDLEVSIQVIYYDFIHIDSDHPGCGPPEGFEELRGDIDCGTVDIAAGESLTIDMTVSANPDKLFLKQNCHEKNGLCRRSGLDVLVDEKGGDATNAFAEDVATTRVKPVG